MNNELNMVLKAKVIKLRVELDIKGSTLPTQVNKITKFLRDNGHKVKLKVELITTVKEMTAQLNKIRAMAASKPIKVRIDVDTKGAGQIKDSLNRVNQEMKTFNKNYEQQARQMTVSKQKIQKAMTIEKVPTSAGVANMNFIKNYAKQAQEAERILRSKLPPNKSGIFSTTQFKNAQGDMTSFVATLKRTDGIIESVRYKWNAKKESFVPISRKTLDNSQQALNRTRQTLATMTPKIEAELRKLVSYGKLTSDQFDRAMAQLPRTAKRNVDNLNKQLAALRTTNAKIQNEINNGQIKVMAGAGSGTANGLKGMLGAGNMTGIQREIERLKGASVQGIQATDKLGSNMVQLKVRMASTGKTAETLTMQLNRVTGELRQVGAASIDFNPNRNLGFFEQLRVAMARVPIWMVAMTAFYGSIRAVRSAVDEILKVDKALTELKRVASDNINIDTMFRGSVDLSKELGNNIHEILNSVAELARTFGDFNERQLLAITRTGTLMANVSDLNAEEAVQSLVGTMNAFNIEAEESIRIVDSLNEVDNNFAISTKQLSEGLSKSASTAKTFGKQMPTYMVTCSA